MAHNTTDATFESTGRTQSQVDDGGVIISFGGVSELRSPLIATHKNLRALRKDPTIALARAVAVAPAVQGEWSIESHEDADEEWVEFAKAQLLPLRTMFMEAALYNGIDFGYAAFEKVFHIIPSGDFAGKIGIKKLKSLLVDLTAILVERDGSFAGFFQERDSVTVPLDQSLLVAFRVEGTQWHGQSLLENALETATQWKEANDGASRYDKKMAGAHWVITYPIGKAVSTTVEMKNGIPVGRSSEKQGNREIAADILSAMQSSGSCCLPGSAIEGQEWKIELMADNSAKQISFVPRLQYLDTMKVRAMLLPERAVLEGRFGTKAEAETHTDIAVVVMQMYIDHVTTMASWYVLDQLLELNFGTEARGMVWIAAPPLADSQAEFQRAAYLKLLSNPQTLAEEYPAIDTNSMREQLGVPQSGIDVDREGAAERLRTVPMDPNQLNEDDDDPDKGKRPTVAATLARLRADYAVLRSVTINGNGRSS